MKVNCIKKLLGHRGEGGLGLLRGPRCRWLPGPYTPPGLVLRPGFCFEEEVVRTALCGPLQHLRLLQLALGALTAWGSLWSGTGKKERQRSSPASKKAVVVRTHVRVTPRLLRAPCRRVLGTPTGLKVIAHKDFTRHGVEGDMAEFRPRDHRRAQRQLRHAPGSRMERRDTG